MRTFLATIAVSLLLLALPAVAGLPASRLAYAQSCAAEMGAIPAFNCMTGTVIPITVGGVAQNHAVDDCDKPVQLGLAGDSQCVPFSRFLRIDTKPDVETIVICRKYEANDDGANDPHFSDIAVIQHSRVTGNTCFFQSPLLADLDGTSVPSPQSNSSAASDFWDEPSSVRGIHCPACHDADPFIWSQYIDQVADTSNWNACGRWNSNFQDMFGATVKVFRPDNACLGCHHRFGDQVCAQGDAGGGHVSVAEVATKHWMPIGFSGSNADWTASWGDAVAEIHSCCSNPNQAKCKTAVADGSDGTALPNCSTMPDNDADDDGILDDVDNCKSVPNPDQANPDGDTLGSACDNCPGVANQDQKNTDGANDGGDACDTDDDNDTCLDTVDDEPLDDSQVIGSRPLVNCPKQSESVSGWAGENSDNDNKPNCNDPDDDNDGIADADDHCPVHHKNLGDMACQFAPKSCPFQVWWDVCQFGACNMYLIKLVAAVNPDPTREVVFERFSIVDRAIYLRADSRTLAELSAQLRGRAGPLVGNGRVRLEIWTRERNGSPGRMVAQVAEFAPNDVRRLRGDGTAVLRLSFARDGKQVSIKQTAIPQQRAGATH